VARVPSLFFKILTAISKYTLECFDTKYSVLSMEEDYFDSEKSPSYFRTCLAMFVVALFLTPIFLTPLELWERSDFLFIVLVVALIIGLILMPVAWWAEKRIRKWARKNAERREREQYLHDD
jgi:cell division protein FtsW (lipid II flippase)